MTRVAGDDGSASVEFLAAGLLLILPLIYLVLFVSAVHGSALAVEAAARQGARVMATAGDEVAAHARLADAVEFALADQGLDAGDADITVRCTPVPGACLTRGGRVSVTVELRVPLPLAPPVLGLDAPSAVPVSATASQPVSRFGPIG